MAVAMIGPKFYAWDRNGKPLAFGKLYTYQARTNTPKPTYQSEDQVVENTNPVILNGEGYANVYLDGSYKMVLKDDKDNEIWSSDPVSSAQPDEWVNCLSATYLSPTSFKVSGNFLDSYEKDRRVRLNNNTTEFSYSSIESSIFAGGETTITVIDPVVTTGLIEVCASIVGPDTLNYDTAKVKSAGSTEDRELSDRFSDYTNVKDFGAKGDGSTLNTSSIQNAINYGETIYFPDGVYITEKITLTSNKHLILSDGAVLKSREGFMTEGDGSMLIDIASGSKNVSIKGGTISGNLSSVDLSRWPNLVGNSSSPFSTTPYLIWLRAVSDIVIDGVNFIDTITSSLRLFTLCENVTVRNCYFDNILGNCIDGGVSQLSVTNNTVNLIGDIRGDSSSGTKGGLVVANCFNAVIAGNNIRQTTDSSIYITGQPGGSTSITGNVIKYSGKDAIKALESSNNCTIASNIVIAAGKTCIGVFDDGVTDVGHSIIANNIIGYVDTPTDILDPLSAYAPKTITGCTNQSILWSSGATEYGSAAIGANASNLIIQGNKISNVEGVAINPTEQNISITNNLFFNVTGVAIKQQNLGFVISDNIFGNIGYDAARSFNGEVYGISITGVNIRGVVSDNVILQVGGSGIYADANLDVVNIEGNVITNWGEDAGIYLNGAITPGTSSRVTIGNNNLEGTDNSLKGIYCRSIDGLSMSGNIVDVASDGVRVDASGDVSLSGNNVSNCSSVGVRVSGATLSAAVIGNICDTAVIGIQTDSSVLAVTAFGNIGRNCSSANFSFAASGGNIKPSVPSDANI